MVSTILVVLLLVGLFYAEENWRGNRAWAQTRRALEAKGASLDWAAHIPPPVPDEQNILKAPKMAEWFVAPGGADPFRQFGTLLDFAKPGSTDVLAEVTVLAPGSDTNAPPTDLTLRYRYSVLNVVLPVDTAPAVGPDSTSIPLIIMDDVPLTIAIKNLARQADLKYVIDPSAGLTEGEPQPSVSIRWENVTALEALLALLGNYNLRLIENQQTGVVRIFPQDPSGAKIRATRAAREQITNLVAQVLAKYGEPFPKSLTGAQDLNLLDRPLSIPKPLRVTVQSDTQLTAKQVSEFFPQDLLASTIKATGELRTEPAGSNTFRVFLGAPLYYTAAEYLAWSDQFVPDLDLMREAFKRPYARMDGDYFGPLSIPHLNFVMIRKVSQMLGQRAQCFLLLGRPDEALRELTLLNEVRRLNEPKMPHYPVTVVEAMIDVAVTGIYVNAIADGARMRAWHESELAFFQEQLGQIDLPPVLRAAFQTEQAGLCHEFLNVGPRKLLQSSVFTFGPPPEPGFAQRLKDARYALLVLAPSGWTYQNMALAASLQQLCVEIPDLQAQTVSPRKVDAMNHQFERAFARTSARNFLAAVVVPNFTRAWKVLARNQARASEALIVCALERHRLARGSYPQTLEELAPQFAGALPRDPITGQPFKYRRTANDAFVLYSVGWNEKDDGGTVRTGPKGNDSPEGDWVWQ